MRQEALERLLNKPITRRRALGLGISAVSLSILKACGGKSAEQEGPCFGSFAFRIDAPPVNTPIEAKPEQLLSPEKLESLNVKVFNFSQFSGRIEFTNNFVPLLKPLQETGAYLRIVFVDYTPTQKELDKNPLNQLAQLTDKQIEENKGLINRDQSPIFEIIEQERSTGQQPQNECEPSEEISPNSISDNGGFIKADYKSKVTITIVVGIKDYYSGYEDLETSNFRTVPDISGQGISLMDRFLHEMKHAQDFAGYANESDPQFKQDFDQDIIYDLRPGEIRAIKFAAEKIKDFLNGELPPIVIFGPNGEILKRETSFYSTFI